VDATSVVVMDLLIDVSDKPAERSETIRIAEFNFEFVVEGFLVAVFPWAAWEPRTERSQSFLFFRETALEFQRSNIVSSYASVAISTYAWGMSHHFLVYE
jgi:hypothetical protein